MKTLRIRPKCILAAITAILILAAFAVPVFAAESVDLDKEELYVKAGTKKATLTAYIDGSKVKGNAVDWESSDTDIADVTNGTIKFTGEPGKTVISAKSEGGGTGKCEVYVVGFKEKAITIGEEDVKDKPYELVLDVGDRSVSWKSSNSKIVSVEEDSRRSGVGLLTPKGAGKATITAKVDKISVSCTVTSTFSSISLNKEELVLKGSKKKGSLKATVMGPSKTVSWSSSDEEVATVDSKGRITCKGPGTTVITAEANGKTAQCTVKVTDINKSTLTLNEGETFQFEIKGTDETPVWKSSNSKALQIDENGLATPVGYGKATVTGKADGVSFTCKVTSTVPSIKLSKSQITVTGSSKTGKLTATVTGPSKKASWESSNPDIASVDQKGKITYKAGGTVKITAEANGKSAECEVNIVRLNKTSETLSEGDTLQLSLVGVGDNEVTWKSSNAKVATVSEKGLVTPLGYGKANITASAVINDKKVTSTCKINSMNCSIKLNKEELNITTAKTASVTAAITGPSKKVSWESSNPDVVAVSGTSTTGKLTVNGGGIATVTATANGKSASCKVNVKRLNVTSATLNAGETLQLTLAGATPDLTWKSSSEKVATVTDKGLVTPVGYGNATITAKDGNQSFTCKIVSNVSSITLNETDLAGAEVGDKFQLKATVTGKEKTVTWTSSNEDVATVNKSGQVILTGPGEAEIRATANGVTAVCKIHFSGLNYKEVTLNEGDTITLKLNGQEGANLKFESDDPNIASVDEKGVVRPTGYGSTIITVTAGTKKLYCTVNCTITNVEISEKEVTGYKGGTHTLTAKYNGPKKGTITWKTSDKNVVTVSKGKLTFKGPGTATVTASANNKSAECKVTVLASATNIKEDSIELEVGEAYQLTYEIEGATEKATWKSSSTKIATVKNGLVYGVKAGTATITLTANGTSDTVTVNVVAAGSTTKKQSLSSVESEEEDSVSDDKADATVSDDAIDEVVNEIADEVEIAETEQADADRGSTVEHAEEATEATK